MAVMPIQPIDPSTGLVAALAAVNSSDTFANDGKTNLHVNNGSGGSITVTVTSVLTTADDAELGQVALSDLTFTVAAGARRILPYLKPARFNNAAGAVTVSYSATTSVTAAAVQAQRPL